MGSNQGPTRMALAEATAAETACATSTSRVDANLDLLRVHAHVTRPELYDAADDAGPAALAGLPAAVGLRAGACARRRCARPARWSTCSATTRASCCGARTTSRSRSTCSRVKPSPRRHGAAAGGVDVPADVEQGRARPLGRPRPCTRPTRPAPVDPHSGVLPGHRRAAAPTPTSTSAGTTDGWTGSPPRCGRCRASPASSPSSARRPCPRPPTSWSRSAGPTSTGTICSSTTRCQKLYFDRTSRRREFDSFDGVARRDPGYQAALDPAAGRGPPPAQARPDRRVLPLLLRRRAPRRHLVGARPRPRAQGRLRRAPRRLPDRPADARAPDRLVHVVSEARARAAGRRWSTDADGGRTARHDGPATSRPTPSATSAGSTSPTSSVRRRRRRHARRHPAPGGRGAHHEPLLLQWLRIVRRARPRARFRTTAGGRWEQEAGMAK